MAAHLTPEQLADRWQRRPEWVRREAKAGHIPGMKIGGLWRFDLNDIEVYETRHKNRDPLSMSPLAAKRLASRGGAR